MTSQVLLLAPSRGQGGGIERYAETVQWALAARAVRCHRVDLARPGPAAHVRMLDRARRLLPADRASTRLVVLHRRLLPAATVLAREKAVSGVSLICHGCEVWGGRAGPRSAVERRLMRRPEVRAIAVSSFTAGTLGAVCRCAVLPPGLSGGWFEALAGAAAAGPPAGPGIELVTAFRLADWQRKGLPELLAAVAALSRTDLRVTVCGSGVPPPGLQQLVREHAGCTLRPGLTDQQLARQLAAADLFVLATRTRTGRHPAGEGFGLVLLEAQVAGTPVVGPAYGGAHDAFLPGITGLAPADETAAALTVVLGEMLRDPARLAMMGKRAAEWARDCFAPDRYAARVATTLL
jgi:phosphatidyl-myo-inositol dimannoside synthase